MSWLVAYVKSSIGKKTLMGITGIALVLFAFVHMAANLQVFIGPDAINSYGASLRQMPALLWAARGGLLLAVLLHIGMAVSLTSANRRARPVAYARKDYRTTGYAARTMAISGLIVFAFIAYHLAHYTLLVVDTSYKTLTDPFGRHDVYSMVVKGFSSVPVSALYIISVGLLCMHLSHGIPSFFQSLGLRHPKYTPAVEAAGPVLAGILFLGFIAVPIGVMAGWVAPVGGM